MHLAQIWRHPIKGLGAEHVTETVLTPGQCLPLDRVWAVVEEGRDVQAGEWARCVNFLRGAKAPSLMAVTSESLADGRQRLRHPDCKTDLVFDPAQDFEALAEWLQPIWPASRRAASHIVRADRGMTDSEDKGHVSVMSFRSLQALSEVAGQPLDLRRFRGNLWIEGVEPWAEFAWAGKCLTVGEAVLDIVEPIDRCRAPNGNPETGAEDIDMLKLLENRFGHRDFGMKARVVRGGRIAEQDSVQLA